MENILALNSLYAINITVISTVTYYQWESGQSSRTTSSNDASYLTESADNVTPIVTGVNATPCSVKCVTKIVSDQVRDIIMTINQAALCQVVSAVGVVVNILNLCVFVKQGLGDAINVTLAGLALADLCLVTFAIWMGICYNPLFNKLDLPFSPTQFVYLTAGLPRLSCARASSWILAFASVERCLCITKPLTFRAIITPKRSFVFVVCVYVVMATSVIPTYYTSRLVWSFDAALNRSVVSLEFTSDRFAVDNVVFGVGVFLSVASFVSVAVCTAILTWSLKKKTKWRETNAMTVNGLCQTPLVSYRNKRTGKMISIISAFFIVCYTPNTVNQLVMCLVQELAKNGDQINANQVSWSFGNVLESVNASVNIVIYYKMSSRFRSTLISMFKKTETPLNYELRGHSHNT